MARQEAAPRRLSSESTTPAPQRGTRRASTSRLRRRRASFPRNTPTPSGWMTPARSQRTCWALALYLRSRCSPSPTPLRHHPSIKRARLPPASSGVGQNLAATAILLRAMPEPSTTEGRRIQRELKNLLEDATV
jgi:hypothetical protein